MDLKAITIGTYDASAETFAEKFAECGVRTDDVARAISLLSPRDRIHALELGCGNGRDAEEIIKHVDEYLGIDASKSMIDLAKKRDPALNVIVGDIETFPYSEEIDVAFAFASLLHVSPDEVRKIFRRLYASLTPGGIVYISTQEGDGEDLRDEPTGTRLFHLYTPESLRERAGSDYEEVYRNPPYNRGKRRWFEIALRRKEKSE